MNLPSNLPEWPKFESANISGTVTTIGEDAFRSSLYLETVTLDELVKTLHLSISKIHLSQVTNFFPSFNLETSNSLLILPNSTIKSFDG